MVDVVQYYVDQAHNTPAAIAFLQERAKIEPKESKLIYSLAALEASIGRATEAVAYLTQASKAPDGTNALLSATVDARFAPIQQDPRYQALISGHTNAAPSSRPLLREEEQLVVLHGIKDKDKSQAKTPGPTTNAGAAPASNLPPANSVPPKTKSANLPPESLLKKPVSN
jgi:hypothetical protein